MCGRLNITDDPFVSTLLKELEVVNPEQMRYSSFVRATDTISIVREVNGKRQIDDATWWLLLEQNKNGEFKPSRYTSFNTRYDKLNQQGSAGYQSYRSERCAIIATGFGETEFKQQGKRKIPSHYHNFYPLDSALVFGGLYKQWVNKSTGEVTYSTSIITNPPHEKLLPFHRKASPLMLNQMDDSISRWLDCQNTAIETLNPLFFPSIHQALSVVEIDKPSVGTPISSAQLITMD